ncbi:hypothetical protein XEUV586_17575 [Xanthomonas euvesicatoria]|nr:hypothetical protein XEUV586_17575 [Xanthomonas euvesicatoria]
MGLALLGVQARPSRHEYSVCDMRLLQEHGTFFRLPSLSSWRILVFIGREVLMAGLAKSI